MTLKTPFSSAQAIGARTGFIFLALLPVAVWLTNPHVLGNVIGDVDTWFYFGSFMDVGRYSDLQFHGPGDYYATRLPFIIPGYIVFHLFSLEWAKAVFAYLAYSAIIWPLYYTLRAHMASRTAQLAVMLIAADLFVTRTVNWNYVDTGVMAYQALTFAALTAARTSQRQTMWAGIAGFLFTCSIFCHLGSALAIIPFAGYAWLCFEPNKQSPRGLLKLLGAAVAGVAICQILIGVLNVWINQGNFFFFLLLLKIGRGETHSLDAWLTPILALRDNPWLALPFASWVACGLALAGAALRLVKLERFQLYALLTAFGTCSVLYLLDSGRLTYFLGRAGLYATLYLIFCYIGIAGLLMRGKALSMLATLVIGATFLLTLLIRLHYNGTTIPGLPTLSGGVWLAGLGVGLALAAGFFISNTRLKTAVFCIAAVPTLFIHWTFDDTRDAYRAFTELRQMSDNKLPIIWADINDPLYRSVILPLTASFTERGWWVRGDQFPKTPPSAYDGDLVFVVSSTLRSLNEVQKLVSPHVDRVVPVSERILHLSRGDLWIGTLRIWNWIGFLGDMNQNELKNAQTPAAQFFTLVARTEGGSRHSIEGKEGKLTFGPYMTLAKGRYEVTIIYGPSSGDQNWDVTAQIRDRATALIKGPLPPTTKHDARVTAKLDLPKGAYGVEIRTQYSGQGTLSVHRIGLRPLPDAAASPNAAP